MSRRPRRNHSPAFKAKVALAGCRARPRWPSWLSVSMSTRTKSANFDEQPSSHISLRHARPVHIRLPKGFHRVGTEPVRVT